jgi:polyribonucleotide nucleotidyltransferase
VAVVVADSPDLANAAVQGIMSAIDSTAAESGKPAQHKGVTAKGLDRGAGVVAISAGQEFSGPVKAIVEYGAFVGLTSGVDGLLHVSKLKPLNGGQRVERVADVLRVGQVVTVRVAEVRPGPKYSLELADAGS